MKPSETETTSSPKRKAKRQNALSKKAASPSSDAVAVSKKADLPREYETESLETLFSRVLSRGFKSVNKNTNLTQERCGLAMRAVIARGMTSVNFLQAKLNQGTLGEKALALWLIGSMGSVAKSVARDVSTMMARSWQVSIKRCVKKGGHKTTCADAAFDKEPTWTVMAGCRALSTLTNKRAVAAVAELGLRGRVMLPCLDSFLNHLNDSVVRNQLIDSWALNEVQEGTRRALKNAPKSALSFALHWFRRIKDQPEPTLCPFKEVLGAMNGPIMTGLKGRIHPQELNALKAVTEGVNDAFVNACVTPYLNAFGVYENRRTAMSGAQSPMNVPQVPVFTTGQFCPGGL